MAKRSASRRSRTAFSKSAFTAGRVKSSVGPSGVSAEQSGVRPQLPDDFCQAMEAQFGLTETQALCAALETVSPVSIRFNPYKVALSVADAQGVLTTVSEKCGPTDLPVGDMSTCVAVPTSAETCLESKKANAAEGTEAVGCTVWPDQLRGHEVPWCPEGYYLPERPSFTLDPVFHAGGYYVQEAGSMFIGQIFRQLYGANPEHSLRVLDLCAAPGGKTTLLSTLVGESGLVVANEVIRQRAATLVDNVRKWGLGNTVVTNNDPSHFAAFRHYFDLVLVDAPCSGEGMFRKTPEARTEWSVANVNLCAARSRRILSDVWETLKPGGILIYSTCTFNCQEDEETVKWLVEEYGCESVTVTADPAWGIVQGEVAGCPTFHFFPHRVQAEGFFAAVLRKPDERSRSQAPKARKAIFSALSRREEVAVSSWFAHPERMTFQRVGDNIHAYFAQQWSAIKELSESLSVLYSGVLCGQLFGEKLRPEHPLALFYGLSREQLAVTELPLEEAVSYLRKTDLLADWFQEGINLVTYRGLALGWIKRIGNRCNNMYPKELRIVNL